MEKRIRRDRRSIYVKSYEKAYDICCKLYSDLREERSRACICEPGTIPGQTLYLVSVVGSKAQFDELVKLYEIIPDPSFKRTFKNQICDEFVLKSEVNDL